MPRYKDIRGQTFGELTAVEFVGTDPIRHHALWRCTCSCGNEHIAAGYELSRGNIKTCGCSRKLAAQQARKSFRVDGKPRYRHPLYQTWKNMRRRCNDTKDKSYPNYGGRGIAVGPEWLNDFPRFVLDMGPKPEGAILDRIDPDGNYSKDNCRWVNRNLSSFNTRLAVNNSSGKTGVYPIRDSGRYSAVIRKEGRLCYLGSFDSYEQAVSAREAAEVEVYGQLKVDI